MSDLTDGRSARRHFFTDLLRIALPIALTNLVISSVNLVDTIMVGRLGATELAAVGLGNQVYFLLILMLFGVSTGAGVFVAQFWGKQDVAGIRKTVGLGLVLALAISAAFTAAALVLPRGILGLYSRDPAVIAAGADYLSIVAWSYIPAAVCFCFSIALRGVEQVRLPLVATVISLLTNVALNWVLIFGHFGFPALGVRGAAIATVIARALETVITLGASYLKRLPPAGSLRQFMAWRGAFAARYFKIAAPVVLNETAWALGMTVYNSIFARINTNAIAAYNVVDTVSRLAMVLFLGTANAAAVMLGKCIGEGDRPRAFAWATRFAWLAPLLGLGMSALLLPVPLLLPHLFSIDASALAQSARMILVLAAVFPFKVFNLHLIVGICRSGGDTRFGAFFDIFGVWGLGVPLALLGAFVLKLAPWQVYVLLNCEEVIKMFWGLWRLRSRRWLNDVTA
ncbi:MAG: MATE family efflux transporter [Spirochaetes bacterium GWD1_61_31]|nr:MAG: MATE family efflux transporter [Spirochaetes bacterium GWB1_60_80]OHD31278.1 MAG: MATE family efflux transporter [Spirochaetes bacterium GWC1_61_12]OHD39462.1 MAG: MATE family efflux transporter [Spirochaetes bacterium GWD1_61_31]OHD45514.1 MAG: MATE family efflux transporter [Spirochaetes bacterium GWE1_60_18]OHD58087.1 MAG: MATE family efflux transporter [Spirochaetes bacterium GWF1_60_12]HAP44658.1 MATE family efflux transporter [Spirochaetaceae bacterium]